MKWSHAICSLAVAATFGLAVAADEPQRPQDVMEAAVAKIATELKSSRTKLKHGVRGFGQGAAAPSAVVTQDTSRGGRIGGDLRAENPVLAGKPAECCGPNVAAIAEQLRIVRAVIEEYGRRLQGDEEARTRLAKMASAWKSMDGALTGFRATDSREVAESALGAFQAELVDLNGAHEELVECCVPKTRKNQQ